MSIWAFYTYASNTEKSHKSIIAVWAVRYIIILKGEYHEILYSGSFSLDNIFRGDDHNSMGKLKRHKKQLPGKDAAGKVKDGFLAGHHQHGVERAGLFHVARWKRDILQYNVAGIFGDLPCDESKRQLVGSGNRSLLRQHTLL